MLQKIKKYTLYQNLVFCLQNYFILALNYILFTAAFLVACIFFLNTNTEAQSSDARYFYMIELPETGEVVRRGLTTQAGIPNSGQLILAPDTEYRYWLYAVDTGFSGSVRFVSAPSGQQTIIPGVILSASPNPDTDQDGLDDDAGETSTSPIFHDFSVNTHRSKDHAHQWFQSTCFRKWLCRRMLPLTGYPLVSHARRCGVASSLQGHYVQFSYSLYFI